MSTFSLETVVKDIAINIDQKLEVVNNCAKDQDSLHTATSGETAYVRLPDFGGSLQSGLDASSTTGAVTQASVPVTLGVVHQAVSLSSLESAFKAGNAKTMIIDPRISKMGSGIQSTHLDTMFKGIGNALIYNSGTGDYKHAQQISAYLENSRINGDNFLAMSPQLSAEVKASGLAYFQASSLDKTFATRAIGDVESLKCMRTPDITNLATGTHALGASTTMKIKTLVNTDGATGFTLKVAGGTATLDGTATAGEVILLTGVNGVDVYGNDTGVQFPFVVQTTATAGSNELAVTTQPIYFSGPRKNVSVSSLPADTVATFGMTASSTYKRGIAWTKPAVIFANRMLDEIASCENQSVSSLMGVKFLQSKGGSVDTAINKVVWRFLTASTVAYNSGVCGYFVKV